MKVKLVTSCSMTVKQKQDVELCLYFCPNQYYHPPTDDEVREFLDWSERGLNKQEAKFSTNPIILGKSRRGLTIEMWEQGVLEGTTPYLTLLGGEDTIIPRTVVDFMKREMFKGEDADIIERAYQSLI